MGSVIGGIMAARRPFRVERVTRSYDPLGTTEAWADVGVVTGWLDMLTGTDLPNGGGDAAFVEESTHVLVSHGIPALMPTDADRIRDRLGRGYAITYVDDVAGLGHHLEIYLRYQKEGTP